MAQRPPPRRPGTIASLPRVTEEPSQIAAHHVYPDPDLQDRSRLASTLRRLGNALVRHRPRGSELAELEVLADRIVDEAMRTNAVPRPGDYMARRYQDPRPPDGAEVVAFSDRPFSGPANPMGFEVELRRHGDAARAKVRYGAAFESAPGRAHGGAVSAAVDDVMGYLMVILGVAAFTARLEVDYLAGVPVDEPVWFEAVESEREGRKLHVSLTVRPGTDDEPDEEADPLITARGLFVILPPDRV